MLFYFACEAAGASSARHSLRPLNFRWLHTIQTSRGSRGEIAEVWVTLGLFENFKVSALLSLIPPACGVETSEARSGVARSAGWG